MYSRPSGARPSRRLVLVISCLTESGGRGWSGSAPSIVHSAELARPIGACSASASTSSACFGCSVSAEPTTSNVPSTLTSICAAWSSRGHDSDGATAGSGSPGDLTNSGNSASSASAGTSRRSAKTGAAAKFIHGGPAASWYGGPSGLTSETSAAVTNSPASASYSATVSVCGQTVSR